MDCTCIFHVLQPDVQKTYHLQSCDTYAYHLLGKTKLVPGSFKVASIFSVRRGSPFGHKTKNAFIRFSSTKKSNPHCIKSRYIQRYQVYNMQNKEGRGPSTRQQPGPLDSNHELNKRRMHLFSVRENLHISKEVRIAQDKAF